MKKKHTVKKARPIARKRPTVGARIIEGLEQAIAWTRGEDHARRFELPTARAWCNSFCATCGSSVPWLSRSGKLMIVPAGALEDDPGERPRRNVFFAARAPWYVHASELPCFAAEATP